MVWVWEFTDNRAGKHSHPNYPLILYVTYGPKLFSSINLDYLAMLGTMIRSGTHWLLTTTARYCAKCQNVGLLGFCTSCYLHWEPSVTHSTLPFFCLILTYPSGFIREYFLQEAFLAISRNTHTSYVFYLTAPSTSFLIAWVPMYFNSLTKLHACESKAHVDTHRNAWQKHSNKKFSVPTEMLTSKACKVVTYRLSEPIVLLKI